MPERRSRSGPLHLEIYAEIKRGVLSGEMAPGTVLSEAELSRRWAVSRAPIREALRQLEQDQLISWTPRRGATVANVSVRDLRDMVELRLALEGMAARLAAERAGDGDLVDLRSILEGIDAAHARGDVAGTIELDDAFHRRIALASGNPLLVASTERLLDRVRFARSLVRNLPGRQEEFQREHREIVQAIEAHDPGAAQEAITTHVQRSRLRLLELLDLGAGPIPAAR